MEIMSVGETPRSTDIKAVILIHGIGDLEPQSVLTSACRAIQRLAPGVTISRRTNSTQQQKSFERGQAHIDEARLTWRKHHFRLIEYYWAQIPGKIRARYPFRALRQVLETLHEIPGMSLGTSTSSGFVQLATWCGRAQQALVVWTIVLSIMAVGQGLLHPDRQTFFEAMRVMETGANLDRQGLATKQVKDTVDQAWQVLWSNFPLYTILLSTGVGVLGLEMVLILGCLVAPFAGLAGGAGWIQFNLLWRSVTAGSLLMMASIWTLVFLVQGMLVVWSFFAAAQGDQAFDWTEFYFAGALGILMFIGMGKFGLMCANLLRDAVHYLSWDNRGQPLAVQQTIQDELWSLINRLRKEEEITHMQLVAHSLGSVILVDLLRRHADVHRSNPVFHFDIVTAGSPLRRMIARLFPNRFPYPAQVCEELTRAGNFQLDRWINVYRILDYVGQGFSSKGEVRPGYHGIEDHLLRPWYRPPFGHSNYWGDDRFVRFVAAHVLDPGRESTGKSNGSGESP